MQPAFIGAFVLKLEMLERILHPEIFSASGGDAPLVGIEAGPVGAVPAHLEAPDFLCRAVGQIEVVHAVTGQFGPVQRHGHACGKIRVGGGGSAVRAVGNGQRGKSVHGGLNGGSYGAGEEDVLSGIGAEVDAGNHDVRAKIGKKGAQAENHAVGRGAGNGCAFEEVALLGVQTDISDENGVVHREAAARAGMLFGRSHGAYVVACAAQCGVEQVQIAAVDAVVVADEYAHEGRSPRHGESL